MPLGDYYRSFLQLLVAPFDHLGTAWPILPVYTTLILGELYRKKISFGHAVGNGFVMLWAGLSWARHLASGGLGSYLFTNKALAWIVTGTCIALAVFTIVLGLRKKDKALCEILGHTRFSCYFIILIYPMQLGWIRWDWQWLAAILIFALPCWLIIYALGRLGSRVLG